MTGAPADRPRVLHLLKWLPRGGIETWLTHIFANSTDSPVQHEVLLMQDEIGPYEDKVRRAGVVIHTLPMRNRLTWFAELHRFLRRAGPFAAFHAHVDSIVAGPALTVAAAAGVPARLIHNHSARSMGADYQKLKYRLREGVGNRIATTASTCCLAISDMAMEHLAGLGWRKRNDCRILLYGFDFSGFHDAAPRAAALRQKLEIAPQAKIIGHIGRFDPVKNHAFLIDVFAQHAASNTETVLVLIGRGPLRPQIEAQVAQLGLSSRVRFVEGTDDVAAFMRLFDVFLFTSFSEGLGIVLLEAQAGGAPVLMPENMPSEVVVVPESVETLALAAGVDAWAHALDSILAQPGPDREASLKRIENSDFDLRRCVEELDAIYLEQFARAGIGGDHTR